jgi:hypothetical protein
MTRLPSLASLSLHDEPTEAPRGERIEYRRGIPFANRRRYKLSGSLLAKWCGLGGVSRASIVKTMRDFNGVYTIQPPTALVAAAVQWGKDHEPDAMRAYQETTRLRLSLGSTRGRAPFAGEDPLFAQLLIATPDAFVNDPTEGVGSEGLLEVQCPADAQKGDTDPLRRLDDDDLLLQAWAQLEMSHTAAFVDLVKWQVLHDPQQRPLGQFEECIWMARLYADRDKMLAVKRLVQLTLQPFDDAMKLLQRAPPPSDADIDARVLGIAAAHGGRGVFTGQLKRALRDWAQSCLKYKDMETGVWRTEEEARAAVPGDEDRALRVLARRYHPYSGDVYGKIPSTGGNFHSYKTVADLFPTERGGETFLRRQHRCAPKAPSAADEDTEDENATDVDEDPPPAPRPPKRRTLDPDRLPGGRRVEWSDDEMDPPPPPNRRDRNIMRRGLRGFQSL